MGKPQELYGIQMLRGMAALSVVIHHALEMSNGSAGRFSPDWLTTCGAFGVDIFFVISGFIMMYTTFGPARPLTSPYPFFRNRALRIYPFYWICLVAMLALWGVGFMKSLDVTLSTFWRSAILFPGGGIINVAWTLSYEMLFYLVFAASLFFRSARVTTYSTILVLSLSLVGGTVAKNEFLANPIMLEFCFGMLLFYCQPIILAGAAQRRFLVGVAAAIFAMFAPYIVAHSSTAGLEGWNRVIAWGIPALIIVAACLKLDSASGQLGGALIELGDASYSMYLTHVFCMIAYGKILKINTFGSMNQIPLILIVTFVCIIVGVMARRYIEKPMDVLLKRLSSQANTKMASAEVRLAPVAPWRGHSAQGSEAAARNDGR